MANPGKSSPVFIPSISSLLPLLILPIIPPDADFIIPMVSWVYGPVKWLL